MNDIKKRILIIMPSMFIGGAERSLLGLLDEIDYEKYDVSLFLYRHEGEFLSYIPKKVNVLPSVNEYATFDVPIKSLLTTRLWKYGIARIIGKSRLKIKKLLKKEAYGTWASMQYISMSLQPLLPKISGSYDAAVSFLGIPDVLLNKVDSKVKIAWNHTDYTILGPDRQYDRKVYSQIDYIVSVSDTCTKQLLSVYPELEGKAITIQNILGERILRKQAEESVTDICWDDETVILSVGRYSEAKNFDNVPCICKMIRERGYNVKWYIIGFGTDEDLIRNQIKKENMEDYVILLGKKINPYPYMKACDFYVQPSRYEGKCVSVLEAQILNKPVIITDFATAKSQLKNGIDGIIVPMDNAECADGIIRVIKDKKLQEKLIENTRYGSYTNSAEIAKFYQIVEDS